jgi:hypothetical protein
MNCSGFTRSRYDVCSNDQYEVLTASPFSYKTYNGQFENCKKCVATKSWQPFDKEIVDTESELKGLGRKLSKCSTTKYNPMCAKSGTCTSTFDKSNPVVLPQEACPIVSTGLPPIKSYGSSTWRLKNEPVCL